MVAGLEGFSLFGGRRSRRAGRKSRRGGRKLRRKGGRSRRLRGGNGVVGSNFSPIHEGGVEPGLLCPSAGSSARVAALTNNTGCGPARGGRKSRRGGRKSRRGGRKSRRGGRKSRRGGRKSRRGGRKSRRGGSCGCNAARI